MSSKSLFDSVVNPQGLLAAAVGPVFLAAIPVTNYITAPNGTMQKAIETLLSIIPSSDSIPKDRVIPALSAFYIFWTFAATGAASAGGLGASRKEGLDNNHPRKDINNLTGLPLRLRSAHYNLMEMFPYVICPDNSNIHSSAAKRTFLIRTLNTRGFALAAALAQVSAPTDQNLIIEK